MKRELHFAMTEAMFAEAGGILFPAASAYVPPERGFIAVVTRSTGVRRRTILVRDILLPKKGDVEWHCRTGLVFSAEYKSRALDAANATRGGLGFIHTHPTRLPPSPSEDDLEADRRDLFHLGQALPHDAPLLAGVVNEEGSWSAREYEFRYPANAAEAGSFAHSASGGTMQYADTLRIVGPGLRLISLNRETVGFEGLHLHAQDSTVRLWGSDGQARLGRLRIAIIGLGGVGGILAEQLARLGVGEIVAIDFDRLALANKNRSHGATVSDLVRGLLKIDVAERLARMGATCPHFDVTVVRGSVVEKGTIDHVLDCDIVLNAADSPWARQVLDHVAFAHLIPVVNGGTELRGDPETMKLIAAKCEIAVTAPGHPCFECADVYSRPSASQAREHPGQRGERAYVKVGDRVPVFVRAPSMISTNAMVAGLMQLRLQALVLGTTPAVVIGTQRYHLLDGTMDFALCRTCKGSCRRIEITALGDLHPLPLGFDLDFAVAREQDKSIDPTG